MRDHVCYDSHFPKSCTSIGTVPLLSQTHQKMVLPSNNSWVGNRWCGCLSFMVVITRHRLLGESRRAVNLLHIPRNGLEIAGSFIRQRDYLLLSIRIASSDQVQRQQRRDEPVRENTHLVLDTLASRLRSYHSIVGVESLVFRAIRTQLIYIQSIVCTSG